MFQRLSAKFVINSTHILPLSHLNELVFNNISKMPSGLCFIKVSTQKLISIRSHIWKNVKGVNIQVCIKRDWNVVMLYHISANQ